MPKPEFKFIWTLSTLPFSLSYSTLHFIVMSLQLLKCMSFMPVAVYLLEGWLMGFKVFSLQIPSIFLNYDSQFWVIIMDFPSSLDFSLEESHPLFCFPLLFSAHFLNIIFLWKGKLTAFCHWGESESTR